jgi:phage terminase Nu1 subunit (DNA packaging protein)
MSQANQIEPFQVTRRQLIELFNSPRLVQRMIVAGWFEVVRQGGPGRETLYDYQSARRAYRRLKSGERPPLLRCEQRNKSENTQRQHET